MTVDFSGFYVSPWNVSIDGSSRFSRKRKGLFRGDVNLALAIKKISINAIYNFNKFLQETWIM